MTLPRPMGRSTPSPAGARTEHRSSRVHSPLQGLFVQHAKLAQRGKSTGRRSQKNTKLPLTTPENDVPSRADGIKHNERRRLCCTTLSLLFVFVFCCFFDFQVPPKAKSVTAQILNKITSDIPSRHPASRSTHSRNTSST